MSFIDGLSTFQFQNQVKPQKAKDQTTKADTQKQRNRTDKTDASGRTSKTDHTKYAKLSEKAKALLEELREKYGDTDFIVASYNSDEEAQHFLAKGTKAFTVLIDPEDLEAMANNEDVKNQTLSLLEEARNNLMNIQDQLTEEGDTHVKNLGVTISIDGKISYFAELEKMSQQQKERIEKAKETKAEEQAEAEKKADREKMEERIDALKSDRFHANLPQIEKHTTVYADTIDELLEQIKNVNWDEIEEEKTIPAGRHFDLSI